MSESPKQSPLGVNSLGSLVQNKGLTINPTATSYMGVSRSYVGGGGNYVLGKVCRDTVIRLLTYAINAAFLRGVVNPTVYNNIIKIGVDTIPALGNAKAPYYYWDVTKTLPDPDANILAVGRWTVNSAWAPTGWGADDQYVDTTNTTKLPISAWGFIRLVALQAWGEFNYNDSLPEYKDFLYSFMVAHGFIEQSNVAILAVDNSEDFLRGAYSNMNDLTTADVAGVSLATMAFGNDLVALGRALELKYIETFGLPSNLLKTLRDNNAITNALNLVILASGIEVTTLENIIEFDATPTAEEEKKLYGAYSVIIGTDLTDILIPLNCNTSGLESLADLLNPKKIFPNSYQALTVPLYNTDPGPTNSKTYYPIFSGSGVNTTISSPSVTEKIGIQIPSSSPPLVEPPSPDLSGRSNSTIAEPISAASIATGSRSAAYPTVMLDRTLNDSNDIL